MRGSARTGAHRTQIAFAAVTLAVLPAVLWAAVSLATSPGSIRFDVAKWANGAYGADPFADPFESARDAAFRERAQLESAAAAYLTGPGVRLALGPEDGGGPFRADPPDDALRHPSGTAQRPTIPGTHRAMDASMSSDTAEARPGDEVQYTVIVRNVGELALVDIDVRSHVPAHTARVLDGRECGGSPVAIDPDRSEGPLLCVESGVVPVSPDTHLLRRVGRLEPGASDVWTIVVRIDPATPPGTIIRNHAHAQTVDGLAVDAPAVEIKVV